MITLEKFAYLLQLEESSTLDFKTDNYDLLNDPNENNLAGFIKDILSFSNTIRDDSSYIITGVKSEVGKQPLLQGTHRFIDEAIIQQKVFTKIHPRPVFNVHKIEYKGFNFIVYEFPVRKYALPLAATRVMKGLVPGEIYFRNGSSNTQATGMQAIDIHNWYKSLPDTLPNDTSTKITQIIKEVNNPSLNLSQQISEALDLSIQIENKALIKFCRLEIGGYGKELLDEEDVAHRKVPAAISLDQFELTSGTNMSNQEIIDYILKQDHVFKKDIIFAKNIIELEGIAQKSTNFSGLSKLTTSAKTFVPNTTLDVPAYCYVNPLHIANLLPKIRARLSDLLLQALPS